MVKFDEFSLWYFTGSVTEFFSGIVQYKSIAISERTEYFQVLTVELFLLLIV